MSPAKIREILNFSIGGGGCTTGGCGCVLVDEQETAGIQNAEIARRKLKTITRERGKIIIIL